MSRRAAKKEDLKVLPDASWRRACGLGVIGVGSVEVCNRLRYADPFEVQEPEMIDEC